MMKKLLHLIRPTKFNFCVAMLVCIQTFLGSHGFVEENRYSYTTQFVTYAVLCVLSAYWIWLERKEGQTP